MLVPRQPPKMRRTWPGATCVIRCLDGRQPYSTKCSARDSLFLALFTFGEGYHNYHHEFQYDYRNGVKPWEFDPTKWIIWTLSKIGLTANLRRVASEKIREAQSSRR